MKRIISLVIVFVLSVSLLFNVVATEITIARSKISSDVFESFDSIGATESVLTYVEMEDIDHTAVMKAFSERYPEEYVIYMEAKTKANYEKTTENEHEILQRALERKREIYKEFYLLSNREVLDGYYGENDRVFVSGYAPFAIVETTQKDAIRFAKQNEVIAISEHVGKEAVTDAILNEATETSEWITDAFIEDLILANQINRSDVLRTKYDLTGLGIKIGMIEASGLPDITNEYLCSANITLDPDYIAASSGFTVDSHATQVAAILVASNDEGVYGVVPEAKLYCTIGEDLDHYYNSVEWLLECGVRIINASMGFPAIAGTYDNCSAWTDHIAAVHDVHFVKSAGNENTTNDGYVTSPGMAYNAITVGQFTANSTDKDTFAMSSASCYSEYSGIRPEKPNLVAKGNFGNFVGTSYAAPQVAGIIAQLGCWDGNLLFRQSDVGAILSASAANKVGGAVVTSYGEQYMFPISGTRQICTLRGAGAVDALWAWGILARNNYWHLIIEGENLPYEQTITINTNVDSISRVAIFWTKNNTEINHNTGTVYYGNPPLTNLDIYIYDGDGNLVASSCTLYSNFEIAQFYPNDPGVYTVRITGTSSIKEYIGIALW